MQLQSKSACAILLNNFRQLLYVKQLRTITISPLVILLLLYTMYQLCWLVQFNNAQRGLEYFYQQNYTKALPCLRELLRLKPDLPGVRTMIARSLYEEGKNDAAIVEFRTGNDENQWYADDYYTYGSALWAKGSYVEARIQWTKALRLANTDSHDQNAIRAGYNKHIADLACAALKSDERERIKDF